MTVRMYLRYLTMTLVTRDAAEKEGSGERASRNPAMTKNTSTDGYGLKSHQ